jgi:hypothetical protein
MRLYRLGRGEIAEIVLAGRISARDSQGRPIFEGKTSDGRPIYVVVALDAADFVNTVFGEVPR